METNEEISFLIYYEDTVTPINFESGKTITEFNGFFHREHVGLIIYSI